MIFTTARTSNKLSAVCLWTLGAVALAGNQELEAQTFVASQTTYTFKPWSGGANLLTMTSDISGQTGNNNSTDLSAVLTSVSGKPAVPTIDLAGQLGWQSGGFFNSNSGTYYANGASAVGITFTALADKKQNNTAGAFGVIFDTTGDSTIGSSDQGLALNATFAVQNNTITITGGSVVAFTLGAANGTLAPTSAFTVGSVTVLGNYTASINGSVGSTGTASDSSNYTVSMAALLSDISGTWQPVQGKPTLTTAFTSTQITAPGSANLIDWYGTSATSVQTATLNIPEPATWAWSVGALAPGIYLLRRRRHSASRLRDLSAPVESPATPSGTGDHTPSAPDRP
jgi:hypothetical protein